MCDTAFTGMEHLNPQCITLLMKLWSPNFKLSEYMGVFLELKTGAEKIDHVLTDLKKHDLLLDLVIDAKSDDKANESKSQGNMLYEVCKYEMARVKYNEMITCAKSKLTLSIGYANRSIVLYKLQMYQDCIKDIDRALALEYPDNLRSKLIIRKRQSKKLLRPPQYAYHEPVPETDEAERNPHIDGATKSIKLVQSHPKYGQHLAAARPIKVGEVLVVEEPYVMALSVAELMATKDDNCDECSERTLAAIPCEHCTLATYCGEECKLKAWESHHKWECKIYKTLFEQDLLSPVDDVYILMGLRAALKMRDYHQELEKDLSEEATETETQAASIYRRVLHMRSSIDHTMPDKQMLVAIQCAQIFHLLKRHTDLFKNSNEITFKNVFFNMVFIAHANSLKVVDKMHCESRKEMVMARALYPSLSSLALEWEPNVATIYHGNVMTLRAIHWIDSGEPLLRAHDNPSRPAPTLSQHRMQIFKDQFRQCYCFFCTTTMGSDAMSVFLRVINAHHQVLNAQIDETNNDMQAIKTLIRLNGEKLRRLPKNSPHCFALGTAIRRCLALLGNNRRVLLPDSYLFDWMTEFITKS